MAETYYVSVLPDRDADELIQRFTPLLNHLSNETGARFELVLASDYQDLIGKFQRGEIDLARFGGFTFVKARTTSQAEPLVMRDIDVRFTSYFVVRADEPAGDIDGFGDRVFAFGSELSTSGHLMPRYFLLKDGIEPEEYFSQVLYSGAHDQTVLWVRDGQADIGVANSIVVDQLYAQGAVSQNDVRILARTPPYADYVWSVHRAMPSAKKKMIENAFLSLSSDNPQHKRIFNLTGGNGYLPADKSDFVALEIVARELGLLGH